MVRLADKEKRVDLYKKDIDAAKLTVLAYYRGLTVEQLYALRKDLFKLDAKFVVTKNTLLKRVIPGTEAESLGPLLTGPNAVLYAFGDEIQPLKVLKGFLQKQKMGELRGGQMGGQELSAKDVETLAELPPLEELRGKLLGAINAPQAGLVRSLNGPLSGLVTVLEQYAKQKQASEGV